MIFTLFKNTFHDYKTIPVKSTNMTTIYSSASTKDASLLELGMMATTDHALIMFICALGIVTLGSIVPSRKQGFQVVMIQSV